MLATAAYLHGRSNECAAAIRARRLDEYQAAAEGGFLALFLCMVFDLGMAWVIFGGGV